MDGQASDEFELDRKDFTGLNLGGTPFAELVLERKADSTIIDWVECERSVLDAASYREPRGVSRA